MVIFQCIIYKMDVNCGITESDHKYYYQTMIILQFLTISQDIKKVNNKLHIYKY